MRKVLTNFLIPQTHLTHVVANLVRCKVRKAGSSQIRFRGRLDPFWDSATDWLQQSGWELQRMDGSFSTWMGVTAHGWELQHMDGSYSTWMGITAHGWELQHMDGSK
jgi:hypothetical protein